MGAREQVTSFEISHFVSRAGLSVCVCGTCMLLACGLYDGCNPSISTTCVVCARPLLWELYLVSQDFFILQVFKYVLSKF